MNQERCQSILLIADPYLPVPPVTYGGVERIVDLLAEGLADRGWSVTLACHPESTCRVPKLPLPVTTTSRLGRVRNAASIIGANLGGNFDLIHSFAHFDLIASFWPLARPKIQSFQAFPHAGAFDRRLRKLPRRNLHLTVCGRHMVKALEHSAPTTAIHNGVTLAHFTFRPEVPEDAPLVFLGRIEAIKGTHHAIRIARETGRRLVIAGNISDNSTSREYFTREVEPHLSRQIEFIGPVDDVRKNDLLGNAAALLMPIEWDEPFGIVMAEALACGTPVIGLNRGALPEIVDPGITGACCDTVEEMIGEVMRVGRFSRPSCRSAAETKFSAPVIVDQYVELYRRLLSSGPSGR